MEISLFGESLLKEETIEICGVILWKFGTDILEMEHRQMLI